MAVHFTLITPSLNQASYIGQTVASVIQQREVTGFTLDYIVADGGSQDGSVEEIRKLLAGHAWARLVCCPDHGAADALKRELDQARGTILGWLNSDDVLLPGALASVAQQFQSSDADVVYGRGLFIDHLGRIIGGYPTMQHDPEFLRTFCYLTQPSAFFKREHYQKVGGIDPRLMFCFDYDLWLRLADAGARFHYCSEILSATRLHAGTKSARPDLRFVDEILAMLKRRYGATPWPWQVYRRFREMELARPCRARLLVLLAALLNSGFPFRHGVLTAGWLVRIAGAYAQAWRASRRQLGQRLDLVNGHPDN